MAEITTPTIHEVKGITEPDADGFFTLTRLDCDQLIVQIQLIDVILAEEVTGDLTFAVDTSPTNNTDYQDWENRALYTFVDAAPDDQITIRFAGSDLSELSDGSDLTTGNVRSGPMGEALRVRLSDGDLGEADIMTSVDVRVVIWRK
jgi:hypothetical protein